MSSNPTLVWVLDDLYTLPSGAGTNVIPGKHNTGLQSMEKEDLPLLRRWHGKP